MYSQGTSRPKSPPLLTGFPFMVTFPQLVCLFKTLVNQVVFNLAIYWLPGEFKGNLCRARVTVIYRFDCIAIFWRSLKSSRTCQEISRTASKIRKPKFFIFKNFSGYENFSRTIQGLCEPCINLKIIQWQINFKKSGPKIRSKRQHHFQVWKTKRLPVLQDYMYDTFTFLNTILLTKSEW